MKTAAALLALATGASAFTSSRPADRSTAVRAVIDKYDGSIDLRGKEFKFDPVRNSTCATYLGNMKCLKRCESSFNAPFPPF